MSVEIRIKAVNKFKKGIDGAIAGVKKLGSMVKSVSMAMFRMTKWAVIGLTGIGLWSIKTASAMREMGDKFGRVFKEQSQAAEDFAATLAKHIGRSIDTIKENMTVFQSFFVGLGIGGGEAEKLSEKMTALAFDFASFNDLADTESLERFISALSGSGEVLDRFGINIKQAALGEELLAMGLSKSVTKATEQQKVMARIAIIAKALGTQGAVGNASDTAKEFANRLKTLKDRFKDWRVETGNQIIDGLKLSQLLGSLSDKTGKFTAKLKESKFVEVWAAKLRGLVDDVLTIMDAIAGGGAKGKAAWEGLKRWGGDMAKEAGAVLLSYAPIIGDAIGSAARAAFSGASKGMARRTAARKEIVSEGKAWGGGGTMWGAAGTLGIGPHSAEISRRAAQMKAAELRQQGQALAAKYAGGAGTSLHGLAMDLTDGTITKLSKATADSLKQEK